MSLPGLGPVKGTISAAFGRRLTGWTISSSLQSITQGTPIQRSSLIVRSPSISTIQRSALSVNIVRIGQACVSGRRFFDFSGAPLCQNNRGHHGYETGGADMHTYFFGRWTGMGPELSWRGTEMGNEIDSGPKLGPNSLSGGPKWGPKSCFVLFHVERQ